MPIKTDPRFVGRAWLTPDTPVVAGAWGTWTFTYEVGVYGYDERARLKIAWRFASDWGTPQFGDPKGSIHIDGTSQSAYLNDYIAVIGAPGSGPAWQRQIGIECGLSRHDRGFADRSIKNFFVGAAYILFGHIPECIVGHADSVGSTISGINACELTISVPCVAVKSVIS